MLKQMETEAEEDEEIYDAMARWCETNDKEKTKAIADAQTNLENLAVNIEEMTAFSAKLGTEIKHLEKEVAKNQAALDKATEIRQKQQADFNGEEKDLLGSISALKGAVTVLGKHNGASLLQMPADPLKGIAAGVKKAMDTHPDMGLTLAQAQIMSSFIQQSQDPSSDGSYAPASGQIFGILNQMKETFETNLAATQKDENANQALYDEVKGAKNAEIQAGQTQIDTKTEQRASTDEKNAEAKQNVKDTKANLAADEEFLAMLKETCAKMDAEWEARTKTRTMEMEACSKALAVLSSDEAHDMFTKTFNFMQIQRKTSSLRRARAAEVLRAAAKKSSNPRLSMLANNIKLDAFEKVKKAISDMVSALQTEKADEIKHKDFCVEEFNTNQLATEKKTREKDELDTKIADLEQSIKDLTASLESLKSQIAEMATQMKRAGENREKENKDFQMTVADQRATQKLLNAALEILKGFYAKKNETFKDVTLDQQPAGPPPPPGFKDYSKNKQAGGVQGMIQSIIDDGLDHTLDTTCLLVLAVVLESWWRWWASWLLIKGNILESLVLLGVEAFQDLKCSVQQLLSCTLVCDRHLKVFVFLLTVLTSSFHLSCHLGNLAFQTLEAGREVLNRLVQICDFGVQFVFLSCFFLGCQLIGVELLNAEILVLDFVLLFLLQGPNHVRNCCINLLEGIKLNAAGKHGKMRIFLQDSCCTRSAQALDLAFSLQEIESLCKHGVCLI